MKTLQDIKKKVQNPAGNHVEKESPIKKVH